MVYILKSGDLFKVGYTSNLKKRTSSYMTHNPSCVILCSYDGGRELESYLHDKLSKHRAHEEWFSCYDGYMSDINDYVNSYSIDLIRSVPFVKVYSSFLLDLEKKIGPTDVNYIRRICDLVYSDMNVLMDLHGSPISTDGLMNYLGLKRTRFYHLRQGFCENKVLFFGHKTRSGKKQILLNPCIAVRSNSIRPECLEYFDDLSERRRALK